MQHTQELRVGELLRNILRVLHQTLSEHFFFSLLLSLQDQSQRLVGPSSLLVSKLLFYKAKEKV
jgi:hypothetical protein